MDNIWFFHHYATVPYRNGYVRPFRFAEHIKDNYKTSIFCSSYHHWSGEQVITDNKLFKIETVDDVNFVYVKTPSSAAGAFARIVNMLSFMINLRKVGKKYLKSNGLPEVIVASSPHPFTMLAGIWFAKRYKIPCICEIRDLWPEAIFYGSKLKEKSIIGKLLISGEYWIYKKADALIFTKEGDTDYLKEHKWTTEQGGKISLDKCFYINNGIEFEKYQNDINENKINDTDLDDDTFKVVYAGAIRPVNNVGNIIEAANLLKKYKDIKFLIYGDGNQKEQLKKKIIDYGLENVVFKGFVENKFIPYILSKSSVNLLNYSSSNYNWTRGNSSNKLFEYLASGKPVISTVKTGYSIIQKYDCGFEMNNQTAEGLAANILRVKALDKNEYDRMCLNALRGAKDFDYNILSEKLLKVIDYAVKNCK